MTHLASTTHYRSSRAWLPVALLALALGATAVLPAKAQAADVQVRILVDVADLVFRSGRPYYYDQGYYQPVVMEYDPWRRPVYYRYGPRPVVVYRPPPRYYAPPRHYAPPPRQYSAPYYRAGYGDYRRDDRRRDDRGNHDRDPRRGHGHGRYRDRWSD